jgi:hypothetical protein
MSTLTDAIYQNTAGNSQGYPLGVPTGWNWYQGWNPDGQLTPPSNFTSVTGWGVVYPESGAPADSNPSASVQIANFQTYVHLTSGAWVLVQNQSTAPIAGAHYLADFSGNSSVPWNETTLSDGSASVDAPQSGYNDHFWPDQRGTYAAGTVDGVFVEASMKTNDPNENLVAELGADWWLNSSAPFVSDFSNNPGAGSSDWVKLTTQYQSLYFTSLSPQELQADPPPGLQTASPSVTSPSSSATTSSSPATTPSLPATTPAVTQATASPGTGVEQVGDTIALTLAFNEAVTVTGKPTLTLNDGGIATYVGGSGTGTLTFDTAVASSNTSTSALGVTSVNLPSGASIKDASGASANLSGAVTTFSGLQVDTSPVSAPTPSGPTDPVLSVADNTLSVTGSGGNVNLGVGVTATDNNDAVSVNIKGLPRYETITDNLDGHTFRGKDITLTAAQVDSGLTLHSYYRGWGDPTATLSVTATGKDPVTGILATSATKTITVADPPATAGGSSPSQSGQGQGHDHDHSFALLSQHLAGGFQGSADAGQIATAASNAASWLNESILTRPQH